MRSLKCVFGCATLLQMLHPYVQGILNKILVKATIAIKLLLLIMQTIIMLAIITIMKLMLRFIVNDIIDTYFTNLMH